MALQQDSISITQEGEDLLDVQLPQYYREGFFSKDSLFHPELPGGRFGVAGDPVPYSIHNDSVITSIFPHSLYWWSSLSPTFTSL